MSWNASASTLHSACYPADYSCLRNTICTCCRISRLKYFSIQLRNIIILLLLRHPGTEVCGCFLMNLGCTTVHTRNYLETLLICSEVVWTYLFFQNFYKDPPSSPTVPRQKNNPNPAVDMCLHVKNFCLKQHLYILEGGTRRSPG